MDAEGLGIGIFPVGIVRFLGSLCWRQSWVGLGSKRPKLYGLHKFYRGWYQVALKHTVS